MLAGKTLSPDNERVHADKKAAQASGISTSTLYKMDQIMQAAKEEPDRRPSIIFEGAIHPDNNRYATYFGIAQSVIDDKITVEKGYSMISRDKKTRVKQANQAIEASMLSLPERVTLLNSDSMHTELAEIPDSSVDLILTDPPYLKQYVYIYDELAQFALRKLKPGGNLIFYYGKYHQDEVHHAFYKYRERLPYHWTLFVNHVRAHNPRMHSRGVWVEGKSMLWFVKAGAPYIHAIDVHDVIHSVKPDKSAHPWAQSSKEAEYLIGALTFKDSLVVDPFLGSGAFAVAAGKLGRYFIGIEIDKEVFDRARSYIINETSSTTTTN
jgi:DNA methylase